MDDSELSINDLSSVLSVSAFSQHNPYSAVSLEKLGF